MKQLSLLSFLFFLFMHNKIYSQEKQCEVIVENIKGSYTGAGIEGKAHGKGISVGIDTYDGEFKNGYPEGIGTYTWQNQNGFKGNFKKGKMDGTGQMTYKIPGGDSTVSGFWKKGKYVGLYEKQYDVISVTSRINKVNCSLINKKGEEISITMHQLSSANKGLNGLRINSIIVLAGTYQNQNSQSMYNSSVTRITQVRFPFRAIFNLNNGEITEILFNESGSYEVNIDMQ